MGAVDYHSTHVHWQLFISLKRSDSPNDIERIMRKKTRTVLLICLYFSFLTLAEPALGQQATPSKSDYWPDLPRQEWQIEGDLLAVEDLSGDGVWIDPAIKNNPLPLTRVVVWFDRQFLGDGDAYRRRAEEFADQTRRTLRGPVLVLQTQLSLRVSS